MSKRDSTLTQERLKELLHYDPETGVFTRRIDSGYRWKAGKTAGYFHVTRKYWYISINSRGYLLHRLAWFYITGEWPKGDIDHFDGNAGNNRFCNLRDVPTEVNCQNRRKAQKNTSSGFLGVSQIYGRWRARITVKNKTIDLGCFGSPQEAHNAYLLAKRQLHEGCTI